MAKKGQPVGIRITGAAEAIKNRAKEELQFCDLFLDQANAMGWGKLIDTEGIRKINEEQKAKYNQMFPDNAFPAKIPEPSEPEPEPDQTFTLDPNDLEI